MTNSTEKQREYSRKWRRENREKHNAYNVAYRKRTGCTRLQKYGLTLEAYNKMYAQQEGRCLICHEEYAVLCVDHEHVTGTIRGLLCDPCNRGLGAFRDDPRRMMEAAAYVKKVG